MTNKTINQILADKTKSGTQEDRLFAVGAYQITNATLSDAKDALKLTGEERMTPEMQDHIFRDFLVPYAGSGHGSSTLFKLIETGEGSPIEAQYEAAKRWASIAVPAGEHISPRSGGYISDGTQSYYEGPANHASEKATKLIEDFLNQCKK